MLERAVVGLFGLGRKEACGKLPALRMPLDTLAAQTLFGASVVCALAAFEIFRSFTFHML